MILVYQRSATRAVGLPSRPAPRTTAPRELEPELNGSSAHRCPGIGRGTAAAYRSYWAQPSDGVGKIAIDSVPYECAHVVRDIRLR